MYFALCSCVVDCNVCFLFANVTKFFLLKSCILSSLFYYYKYSCAVSISMYFWTIPWNVSNFFKSFSSIPALECLRLCTILTIHFECMYSDAQQPKNVTIPNMAIDNLALYSNIEESHMTSCHMSLSIQSCRTWIAAFWRIVRLSHSTVKQKMPVFQHWFICLRAKYYCRVLWECSSSLACSADSGWQGENEWFCFSWIRLSGLIRKDMRPAQPYGSETSNVLLMKTNQEKGSETFI